MESLRNNTGRFRKMILNNKFVIFLMILLLLGLNIFVFHKISFIFTPIAVLLKTVLLPIVLAGIVYYLLSPIVDYLETRKVPRVYSILVLFVLIIGLITLLLVAVIPIITHQVTNLIADLPGYAGQIQTEFEEFLDSGIQSQLQEWVDFNSLNLTGNVTQRLTSALEAAWSSIGSIVGALKDVILAIITLPFILFYLLKDGRKLPKFIARFFPVAMRPGTLRVMGEMNHQVSGYIRGQILVSCCIGM
ncbi:AI-2E family transporter, partial [Paenibacillus sp. 598K]|uniref:AI-2E family transporter n=1 Tax=Paenibacillus sp. 598K TaxID=1117987 RepID=UPI0021A9A988